MNITATKIFTFDSCHQLPGYDGKCANMHGHTYKLEVTVQQAFSTLTNSGPKDGMVFDFSSLKAIVQEHVINPLDHQNLNEVLPFRTTAELMAAYIFNKINDALDIEEPPSHVRCVKIKLWETPTSFVEVAY